MFLPSRKGPSRLHLTLLQEHQAILLGACSRKISQAEIVQRPCRESVVDRAQHPLQLWHAVLAHPAHLLQLVDARKRRVVQEVLFGGQNDLAQGLVCEHALIHLEASLDRSRLAAVLVIMISSATVATTNLNQVPAIQRGDVVGSQWACVDLLPDLRTSFVQGGPCTIKKEVGSGFWVSHFQVQSSGSLPGR